MVTVITMRSAFLREIGLRLRGDIPLASLNSFSGEYLNKTSFIKYLMQYLNDKKFAVQKFSYFFFKDLKMNEKTIIRGAFFLPRKPH